MNEELKIAKVQAHAQETQAIVRALTELMRNPIVEFGGGMLLIAALESFEIEKGSGNHVLEGVEALLARAWVVSMISLQQASSVLADNKDLLSEVLRSSVPRTEDIGKILPLLPMLAGA